MNTRRWPGSLHQRLLVATLVTLALALSGAQVWLSGLFRDHVTRQFDRALIDQLDQLTAGFSFDEQGRPQIDAGRLSDPRWNKPYSGLYWQLDPISEAHRAPGPQPQGLLRSRSLWDTQLNLPLDPLADGEWHTHDSVGPRGHALRVVERSLQVPEQPQARWRLLVAAETQGLQEAVDRFQEVLTPSLAALGLLLVLAALAQLAVGLAPLQAMHRALLQVREGRTQRLEGRFPAEVQPLIDDFNGVLDRQAQGLARARAQAGNLAHALKTPLAVLRNAAHQAPPSDIGTLVAEQVQLAQRHIDGHLARARAAASQHLSGQRTPVRALLSGLLRVMQKVHAERQLDLVVDDIPHDWAFAGEEQDLQEMLGNLLDNACRSAGRVVHVHAQREGPWLCLVVDDDGPGIAPQQREAVLQRGVRLDESLPGSGLGLAIVVELAALYGGTLTLATSNAGGLRARLMLPAAA